MTSKAPPIAIIPARAGSKGFPKKNIQMLAGKPLYMHSVEAALSAGIPRVIICTDMPEIMNETLPEKVEIIDRPQELSRDETTMAELLRGIVPSLSLGNTTVVLLQPTSPLRSSRTIREGLELFSNHPSSLVMSVSPADSAVLKWGFVEDGRFVPLSTPSYCFANRQSLPSVFRPNGALYVFSAEHFVTHGDFDTEDIRALPIPPEEAIDIDCAADLERCNALLAKGSYR